MKVDSLAPIRSATPRRSDRSKANGRGGFAEALGGEAEGSASVGQSATINAVDALWMLQQVPDATAGRQKAVAQGEDLLDELDEIRIGLLTGSLPLATLERLAARVEAKRHRVDDPGLIQILDEIELRAAVELAKLGR